MRYARTYTYSLQLFAHFEQTKGNNNKIASTNVLKVKWRIEKGIWSSFDTQIKSISNYCKQQKHKHNKKKLIWIQWQCVLFFFSLTVGWWLDRKNPIVLRLIVLWMICNVIEYITAAVQFLIIMPKKQNLIYSMSIKHSMFTLLSIVYYVLLRSFCTTLISYFPKVNYSQSIFNENHFFFLLRFLFAHTHTHTRPIYGNVDQQFYWSNIGN